jgi:hypothetical protein
MKLVSFDVGLRNLAVCVMEGTTRANVKITHWEVIDVMAEGVGLDKPKCYKCKKPANWMKKDDATYSCKTHCPKSGKPPTKKSLNDKTIDVLKAEAAREKVTGSTKKELVDALYAFYRDNTWIKAIKSTKQVSVVDFAEPLAKSMEMRVKEWEGADLIAFEQQPDKRMLCVQAMLHMWFVCRGYRCKGVSATHKLTNIITLQDVTKTYKGRKSTGIIHATELVKNETWKAYLLKHPKKDDLADCFLQGLWVMEH